MQYYSKLGFLVLIYFFLGLHSPDEEKGLDAPITGPPNIILIVADDLGINDLGCYGNTIIETPNIDFMADNGIKFLNAYAASPICSPSRAAIQTGLHPARLALTEHIRGTPPVDTCWSRLPPKSMQRLGFSYTTIGEALKSNNYKTAYVGKWHLGGGQYSPINHGYDISYAAGGQGLPNSFFPPYFNNDPFPELTDLAGEDDYLTDALTTLAIQSITDQESPFFLNLNYYSPHVPIEGPQELVDKYEYILGSTSDTFPKPHYAAMVDRIDQQVGRLIDTLVRRELMQNTIIIFTSDHGALTVKEVEGFDAHTPPTTSFPYRAGKGNIYDGGLRIPLVVYAPGFYEKTSSAYPVINTDFFSTITHLAGDPSTTLDGNPIPALTDTPVLERNLFWHYPHYSPQMGAPASAVLNKEYKLIQWYASQDSFNLFNIENDVEESDNLTNANSAIVNQLRTELNDWIKEIGGRTMEINEIYNPDKCN